MKFILVKYQIDKKCLNDPKLLPEILYNAINNIFEERFQFFGPPNHVKTVFKFNRPDWANILIYLAKTTNCNCIIRFRAQPKPITPHYIFLNYKNTSYLWGQSLSGYIERHYKQNDHSSTIKNEAV